MDTKAIRAILTQPKDRASIAANDYQSLGSSITEITNNLIAVPANLMASSIRSICLRNAQPTFYSSVERANSRSLLTFQCSTDLNLSNAVKVCKLISVNRCLRINSKLRHVQPGIIHARLGAYVYGFLLVYHTLKTPSGEFLFGRHVRTENA